MSAYAVTTCDNETDRRGAGNAPTVLTHLSDLGGRGLGVSLPSNYTSKVARGAASEMIASAHLMSQGYHVFRALAASCPVDLIAYRPGELPLRVEVKSAVEPTGNENINFPCPTNTEWDLLAVVLASSGQVILLKPAPNYQALKVTFFAALEPHGIVLKTRKPVTHCKYGHEFTAENTQRNTHGYRACRECAQKRASRRFAA